MTGRRTAGSNPFSTRFVAPDAATYLFPPGRSAETLLAAWQALGGRAAIVGPHGVGKSTLLSTLTAALAERGEPVLTWRLGGGRPTTLPDALLSSRASPPPGGPPTTLVLDGYEQLSWWRRRTVRERIRRLGWRALVTAHRRTAWPTLVTLTPDPAAAVAVVRSLLTAHGGLAMTGDSRPTAFVPLDGPTGPVLSEADVRAAFDRRRGDLRETLFDLYDVWESRAAPPRPGGETDRGRGAEGSSI